MEHKYLQLFPDHLQKRAKRLCYLSSSEAIAELEQDVTQLRFLWPRIADYAAFVAEMAAKLDANYLQQICSAYGKVIRDCISKAPLEAGAILAKLNDEQVYDLALSFNIV